MIQQTEDEKIQKLNNRTSLEKGRDLWRSWEGK
jgi:hypothetical protein